MAMNILDQLEYESALNASETAERFKIENLDQANWALRKISALNKKAAEIDAIAQAEIERIKSWQQREMESIKGSRSYFESLLAAYLNEQRQQDPKYKISTPYGKVSTRKQQPKWTYDDEKLLAWMKQNGYGGYIRTKEEPMKAELKKVVKVAGNNAVTEDGEIIEGITIEEQPDKLVVEVDE